MNFKKYLQVILNQNHPLKFLISRILMRSNLSNLFTIKLKDYNLKFYPVPFLASLWIDPQFRNKSHILFGDYLKPGDKVLDLGANIGTVTIEAAVKVGSSGKVYAIEPHPRIFSYLQGNIKLNHLTHIQTFNVALGDKEEMGILSDIKSDDQNAIIQTGNGIKVPIQKLDDLPINESKISLMIIDAIGYEKFILLGGLKTLEKTKCVHFPAIERFFEKYGYNYKDILNIFTKQGFELFSFSVEKTIESIDEKYIPDENALITDLLAIRDVNDFLSRTKYKLVK